jgi:DNA-binding NarL/FixJ family response regulator
VNTNDTGEPPIRVYLLAQNRLVREVLVRMFRKRMDLTVVGVNHDSAGAIEELAVIPCDVLLLDSMDTLRAIGQRAMVAASLRQVKIVLFGVEEDPECFLQAVRLGVCGYLLKDASSAQMIGAVRNVMQGEAVCTPKLCKLLFELVSQSLLPGLGTVERGTQMVNDLTCRQRQLMALVAKGMTNKEIAASLQLSQFTVKNHIRRVMTHFRAGSRHQAVDVIRTSGLSISP